MIKGKVLNFKRAQALSREELKERLYRKRFLVPNAVTIGSMFCGFLTTIYAATGRFEKACIAIALALLLDGLDGRVARKLNATSKFGVEFDSLSDLISFGVAPASLLYYWCFQRTADEFGVFVTFIYVICAASRLARFNIADSNLKAFTGLPTPGAAACIAALVNFAPTPHDSMVLVGLGAFISLGLAYLMVSTIEFFSVKMITVGSINSRIRILIGALIALTWYNSGIGFLVLSLGYALSGPYLAWKQRSRTQV
jgi:CDP-diacylglycerol--serine O-phosphatidyltransferase